MVYWIDVIRDGHTMTIDESQAHYYLNNGWDVVDNSRRPEGQPAPYTVTTPEPEPTPEPEQPTSPGSTQPDSGNNVPIFDNHASLVSSPNFTNAPNGTIFRDSVTGQQFYKSNGVLTPIHSVEQLNQLLADGQIIAGSDVYFTLNTSQPPEPPEPEPPAAEPPAAEPPAEDPTVPPDTYVTGPGSVVNRANIVGIGDTVTTTGDRWHIIRFNSDPIPNDSINDTDTIWEYDLHNKVYRRLVSPQAVAARYGIVPNEGETLDQAVARFYGQYLFDVDPANLQDTNSPYSGGTFLPQEYSIQDDGSVPDASAYLNQSGSETGLQEIYGKQRASLDDESTVANLLGAFFTLAVRKGQLSQDTVNKYLMDTSGTGAKVLARYLNAWLYGGYTLGDVYRDLKAKELADQGNTAYDDMKFIDETTPAWDWFQTSEGINARSDQMTTPPMEMLGINPDLLNLPIFQISGEVFKTMIPPIDWDSPEFREEAKKIQAAWYDIMMEKAEANTDQAKAIADGNWDTFRENLERKYGITLSDNATAAWQQWQAATSGLVGRGLDKSGILREAQDRYLKGIRKADERSREEKEITEEDALKNQLLQYGSEADIKQQIDKMDAEDAAAGLSSSEFRSVKWGLKPGSKMIDVNYPDGTTAQVTTAQYFSPEHLKKMYPELDSDAAVALSNSVIDQYGNFRSGLYSKHYGGVYELMEQKLTYQQKKLFDQKLQEEKKAYAPFTSGSPFSQFAPGEGVPEASADAAANIAGSLGEITQPGFESPGSSGIPDVSQPSDSLTGNVQVTNPITGAVGTPPAGWTLDPITGNLKKIEV